MTFRIDRKNASLSVSSGKDGVMLHIRKNGGDRAITLKPDEARMLWTDLGEMLGTFEIAE